MSEHRSPVWDHWDAQFSVAVAEFRELRDAPEAEQKAALKRLRVELGTESRFSVSRSTWLGRLWNWLIDADRTSMVCAPILPIGLVAALTAALTATMALGL